MDIETRVDKIARMIRELVSDAYARGEQDALDRILAAARRREDKTRQQATAAEERNEAPEPEARKRAPKGAVGFLVDRELAKTPGLTVSDFASRAQDEIERSIAPSSIRAHLRRGEDNGRYREEGGRWYLTTSGGAEKDGAAHSVRSDAASDLWTSEGDDLMTPS